MLDYNIFKNNINKNVDVYNEIEDIKYNLAQVKNTLNSGLRLVNIKEHINTCTINYQEAMTDAASLYAYFNIPPNTKEIIDAKAFINIISGTPNITFYISDDGGTFYSSVYGPYSTSQSNIDILSDMDSLRNKIIKVEVDANTTIDFQIIVQFRVVL